MEGGEFFMHGGGIPPPPLHFDPTWQSLSSAMEMQPNELNSSNVQSSADCFFNHPNWEKSTDHQNLHFDSAMSSMVSSPAASNSNLSNENFVIRELIGKLGEISPHSCYTTPMNSPPKLIFPGMEHQLAKENLNFPSLGKPLGLNSTVAEFTADPGFAERAARFSCFGSRSFNGRTRHLGPSNAELGSRCTPLIPRVSSSPSLKLAGSQKENTNSPWQDLSELANSSQESSLSEQVPNGEAAVKVSSELNSRKRKAAPKGKAKESLTTTTPPANAAKVAEIDDSSKAKRSKFSEGKENENVGEKGKEETKDSGDEKPSKSDSKPLKDYIHVRARRGQATDSHSLAERVRREKISERMKLLQDLVPGCNKVTGKALMLDEIINYVQSLQRKVEFLSMKLSSVNTSLDFNMNTLISKEIFQSNNSSPHPTFPLDSSASAVFGHQPQQNPALHSNIAMDDTRVSHNLDGFNQTVAQFGQYPTFCEDDLQSIVQMGFGQNLNQQASLHLQNFYSPNQETHMKIEL